MTHFLDGFEAGKLLGRATVRVAQAGSLVLPTGEIVACDPLWPHVEPFRINVDPGEYSVVVGFADYDNDAYSVAGAMIELTDEPVVRWEMATPLGTSPGAFHGYPVDSGHACFVDASLATRLCESESEADPDDLYEDGVYQDEDEHDPLGLGMPRDATDDQALDLRQRIEEGVVANGGWVNITLDDPSEANMVVFTSGDGDGVYPSYWGYDAADELSCLITHFGLLFELE